MSICWPGGTSENSSLPLESVRTASPPECCTRARATGCFVVASMTEPRTVDSERDAVCCCAGEMSPEAARQRQAASGGLLIALNDRKEQSTAVHIGHRRREKATC